MRASRFPQLAARGLVGPGASAELHEAAQRARKKKKTTGKALALRPKRARWGDAEARRGVLDASRRGFSRRRFRAADERRESLRVHHTHKTHRVERRDDEERAEPLPHYS